MSRPIKTTAELRASYNSYYEHNAMYERVARPTSTDAKPCRTVRYRHIVPLNLCFSFVYILRKKPRPS